MPIDLYPNIAKIKRNGVYQNLPGFVQQSGDADIKAMIASSESSTTAQYAHPKGSYFILNDVLYQADENIAINGAIAVGENCHVAILGDDVAELDGKVEDLTDYVVEKIGYEEEEQVNITYIDGYTIATTGIYGTIVENANYSVSDKISLADVKDFTFYYTGQNPYGVCTWYRADDTCISGSNLPYVNSKITKEVTPEMAYIRISTMTSRKNNVIILNKNVEGQIYEDMDEIIEEQNEIKSEFNEVSKKLKAKYMHDKPVKPLLAEFGSYFWGSVRQPDVFTRKNVVITVSGQEGDSEVTASAISPDTLSISDIGTAWVGGVISADGVTFKPCNFKYSSGSTIIIYPALEEDITNGILSNYMYDSASSYTGLHLTANGYKAFAQHLYEQNPKHCEVGKYVETFRPDLSSTTESPFTWYGSSQITPASYRFSSQNRYNGYFGRYSTRAYTLLLPTSYTPHSTKSGVYWDVDLKGASGYLEAFIFAIAEGASSTLKLPDDQYVHVEVTIDGVKVYDQPITDIICKRVIVDYENANTARLEIYSNKWYPVNGYGYGFGLGRVTWWVNEQEYADNVMFPKGAVIAQEFDSWGVFHDGASGVEMERLHNANTGVSVPYTNHSLGDQTSAWGKAWFYENVWKYNPAISIHDFLINDTNSLNSQIPSTISGPDGATYNNKLTASQYADNMILLAKLAMANGMQPIFMREAIEGQTGYYNFANALIDALSEKIE